MEINTQIANRYYSTYKANYKDNMDSKFAASMERSISSQLKDSDRISKENNNVLEKQSTNETLILADRFIRLRDLFIEKHKLTKENIKNEDDWRKMSDEQWNKLIENIDKHIDDYKKELENMVKFQEEAAEKAAAKAPAHKKALAASKAALSARVNGVAGETPDSDVTPLEKLSWTYNLETDDQVILATAKMANEFASTIYYKAQDLLLTSDTTDLISEKEEGKNRSTK